MQSSGAFGRTTREPKSSITLRIQRSRQTLSKVSHLPSFPIWQMAVLHRFIHPAGRNRFGRARRAPILVASISHSDVHLATGNILVAGWPRARRTSHLLAGEEAQVGHHWREPGHEGGGFLYRHEAECGRKYVGGCRILCNDLDAGGSMDCQQRVTTRLSDVA